MVGKMRRLQEEPSRGTFVADGEVICRLYGGYKVTRARLVLFMST